MTLVPAMRDVSSTSLTLALRISETAKEVRIALESDVLFDFDQHTVRPDASQALRQVADLLRDRSPRVVRVEGHTDSIGTERYNRALSERRAQSVEAWLRGQERLTRITWRVTGHAARRPVVPNLRPDGRDDPEGRQRNRRVEIIFAR